MSRHFVKVAQFNNVGGGGGGFHPGSILNDMAERDIEQLQQRVISLIARKSLKLAETMQPLLFETLDLPTLERIRKEEISIYHSGKSYGFQISDLKNQDLLEGGNGLQSVRDGHIAAKLARLALYRQSDLQAAAEKEQKLHFHHVVEANSRLILYLELIEAKLSQLVQPFGVDIVFGGDFVQMVPSSQKMTPNYNAAKDVITSEISKLMCRFCDAAPGFVDALKQQHSQIVFHPMADGPVENTVRFVVVFDETTHGQQVHEIIKKMEESVKHAAMYSFHMPDLRERFKFPVIPEVRVWASQKLGELTQLVSQNGNVELKSDDREFPDGPRVLTLVGRREHLDVSVELLKERFSRIYGEIIIISAGDIPREAFKHVTMARYNTFVQANPPTQGMCSSYQMHSSGEKITIFIAGQNIYSAVHQGYLYLSEPLKLHMIEEGDMRLLSKYSQQMLHNCYVYATSDGVTNIFGSQRDIDQCIPLIEACAKMSTEPIFVNSDMFVHFAALHCSKEPLCSWFRSPSPKITIQFPIQPAHQQAGHGYLLATIQGPEKPVKKLREDIDALVQQYIQSIEHAKIESQQFSRFELLGLASNRVSVADRVHAKHAVLVEIEKPVTWVGGKAGGASDIKIKVLQRSIEDLQEADAVVVPVNPKLEITAGLCAKVAEMHPGVRGQVDGFVKTHSKLNMGENVVFETKNTAATGLKYMGCAVIPTLEFPDRDELVRSSVTGVLASLNNRASVVAICALGTGHYSYPMELSASLIVTAIRQWVAGSQRTGTIKEIILFDRKQEMMQPFKAALLLAKRNYEWSWTDKRAKSFVPHTAENNDVLESACNQTPKKARVKLVVPVPGKKKSKDCMVDLEKMHMFTVGSSNSRPIRRLELAPINVTLDICMQGLRDNIGQAREELEQVAKSLVVEQSISVAFVIAPNYYSRIARIVGGFGFEYVEMAEKEVKVKGFADEARITAIQQAINAYNAEIKHK